MSFFTLTTIYRQMLVTLVYLDLQVEDQHPGFSYELVKGLLLRSDLDNSVDMTEALLRLEGTNNSRGQ